MDLEARIREGDVNRQFRDATIQFAAPALPPAQAVFPRLLINLPIAFLVALVLAVVGAIAADSLDTTFSDADEVSSRMRLDVLGTLPDTRRINEKLESQPEALGLTHPAGMNGRYEEAIRMLRNAHRLS